MASKYLKGFTVEIGGDTTDLSKALESVNKKSTDLSAELKDLDKLLKFDPGNTDLLAQKQGVLAEAISNTKDRLETLKEAEEQVQKQFQKGEVSEEQVRALQREIVATEQALEKYEKGAEDVAEQLKDLESTFGGTTKETKKFNKETEDGAKETKKLGDSADKAGDDVDGFGSKLASAAKGGLAAVAAGAAAVVAALVGSAEATREYRAAMGKLETGFDATGHSAETATATYKTLQGVIGDTDQSVEAAQQIALLARSEEDAAQWADLAAGVVGRFGDALQPETFFEAANETIKLGEATGGYTQMLEQAGYDVETFNAGLAACVTEEEKQAYMLGITEELLGDAADTYRDVNAEIIRANEANEAWTASMGEIGGAVEPILSDVKLLGASLLSELVPGVESVAEAFRGMLNGDEGAAASLGAALSGIFEQLLTMVSELAPTVAEIGISLITSLTTSLITALPQLVTTGVDMLMAIIEGLTTAIPQVLLAIAGTIPLLVQSLVDGIPQLVQGGIDLLSALTDSIPMVLPVIVAALPQLVMGLVNGLLAGDLISQLINGAVSFLSAIIQAIPMLIELLVPQIPTIVTSIVNSLILNIPILLAGCLQLLQAIIDAIPLICEALIPQLPVIVNTIIEQLLLMTPVLLEACCTLLFALIEAIPVLITELVAALPEVLTAIDSVLAALPELIWTILSSVLTSIGEWITSLATEAENAGNTFLSNVLLFFADLPGNIATYLTDAVTNITTWASTIYTNATTAASNFLSGVGSYLTLLPGKIWTYLTNAAAKVVQWGTDAVAKATTAASDIFNGIVDGLSSLPDELLSIGSDLVEGLWNGISNMTDWVIGKIEGFGDSILSGIKSFFGIESPSRVFRDVVGKNLALGLAEGIEDNADAPIDAMASLGEDVMGEADALNGLTIERQLNSTFSGAQSALSVDFSSVLARLDSMYGVLKNLKVVLDSGETVGALVEQIDGALSDRYDKLARGW